MRVFALVAASFVHGGCAFMGPLLTRRVQRQLQPTVAPRETVIVQGIPKLFRWLTDQYPSVNQRISEGLSANSEEIDNLYLDMNGIIHQCTHGNSDEVVILDEKAMLQKMFTYTDRLFKIVKPKTVFYLAVDGVAPRAKMNQQRSRRFRSSKEQEEVMAVTLARTGSIPDEANRFDSNSITPGTDFMYKLGLAFNAWFDFKMKNDPFWQESGCEVVFSGPDCPGEGEHKVMDFIRKMRLEDPRWSPDLRHVFYGLDADLIMLSLVSHEPNFMLLREKMSVRHGPKAKSAMHYGREDFELLEISVLRRLLSLQFVELEDPKRYEGWGKEGRSLELERVIDDFVFVCMFVGNDFLPHVVHLDIADGSLNMMMNAYKDMLPGLGGYLTEKTKVHLPRLELFFRELAKYEPPYFERRSREKALSQRNAGGGAGSAALAGTSFFEFDRGEYAGEYYHEKFGWDPLDVEGTMEKRRGLVEDYVTGLYWVLEYYHNGVGSWDWFYPHLYAPLASDLVDLATLGESSFGVGRPFTPLMQLLGVLPAASGRLLPSAYSSLMTDPHSPLRSFYPAEFQVDANGKRNAWEAVVKIPFIDESIMVAALSRIDHKTDLSPPERLRNLEGKEHRYTPSPATPKAAAAAKTAAPKGAPRKPVQKKKKKKEEAGKG